MGQKPRPCTLMRIREAAYCFGPFDFMVVVTAPSVGAVEDFVVHCLRAEQDIVADTQTLIGLALPRKEEERLDSDEVVS